MIMHSPIISHWVLGFVESANAKKALLCGTPCAVSKLELTKLWPHIYNHTELHSGLGSVWSSAFTWMISPGAMFVRSSCRVNFRFSSIWSVGEKCAKKAGKHEKLWNTSGSPTVINGALKPPPLTKQADVDLLQRVNAAELVEFVVNFVEYQGFVIVCSEVPHYVIHCRDRSFKNYIFIYGVTAVPMILG